MTVKERLIDYLTFKKISKSDFGRVIGVSSAFVTSMRVSIQPDKIKSIALNYPDLNTEWLITGEGEMIKKTVEADIIEAKTKEKTIEMSVDVFELIKSQQKTIQMQQENLLLLQKEKIKGDAHTAANVADVG